MQALTFNSLSFSLLIFVTLWLLSLLFCTLRYRIYSVTHCSFAPVFSAIIYFDSCTLLPIIWPYGYALFPLILTSDGFFISNSSIWWASGHYFSHLLHASAANLSFFIAIACTIVWVFVYVGGLCDLIDGRSRLVLWRFWTNLARTLWIQQRKWIKLLI